MSTATFLFTDIVNSTEQVLRLGDAQWDCLLTSYRASVRRDLRHFGGREVDAAGDGFFVVFHDPQRAVRCAQSLSQRVEKLGLASRTGVHTGQCQSGGEKVCGLNVHVAARVMAAAQPGEVLVSEATRQSLCASTIIDAGSHSLKGLPGYWALYRAA
jgi:class 3 adenylate cyclase